MQRVISTLGWDGLLPVIVALAPLLTRAVFPKGHAAEAIAAVFLPIALALVRTQVGYHQLRRIYRTKVPWHREAIFAAAIVLLLAFEIVIIMLIFAGDEPVTAWLLPAIVLVGVLGRDLVFPAPLGRVTARFG